MHLCSIPKPELLSSITSNDDFHKSKGKLQYSFFVASLNVLSFSQWQGDSFPSQTIISHYLSQNIQQWMFFACSCHDKFYTAAQKYETVLGKPSTRVDY